ncbi:MAG: GNAT family N-acetyltransferase [Saccharospirillaceae bacterium]|nr:GNAT family N-acetyltransferase [Saccharospirillaceae bacterium]
MSFEISINSINSMDEKCSSAIFKLRDEVFDKRLNWEVTSKSNQESDSYDSLNPIFFSVTNNEMELIGCCRVLPTTGDYMLKNTFPELSRGELIPNNDSIWEISRLALCNKSQREYSSLYSDISKELLFNLYQFAILNNIKQYVFVTSTSVERILRIMNVSYSRMGDGKSTRLGSVSSVALKIDINDDFKLVVSPSKYH